MIKRALLGRDRDAEPLTRNDSNNPTDRCLAHADFFAARPSDPMPALARAMLYVETSIMPSMSGAIVVAIRFS